MSQSENDSVAEMALLQGKVPTELHRRFRAHAVLRGMTVSQLLIEAAMRYLDEYSQEAA